MDSDDRRAVYQQDLEDIRYQDGLRWSRFQTVAAIEGALLVALYTGDLNRWREFVLALVASALVFLVCLLAIKDQRDTETHVARANQLLKSMGAPTLTPGRPVFGLRGREMMLVAIAILNILNLCILVGTFRNWR